MENDTRQYLLTERAHYMCPQMHFGILARIPARYDAEKLAGTLRALQRAHPFLRSLIAEEAESGRLYYRQQAALTVPVAERTGEDWRRDYAALGAQGWDLRRESLLRVLVYPAQGSFSALFAAHHLLCDGRGLLQLVTEFARHYVRGKEPAFAPERLIASIADLPAGSDLPFVSRALVGDANRRWDREGRRVSYEEYLAFEKEFVRENPVRFQTETVEGKQLAAVLGMCRQQGVSVNDWLIARMLREERAQKLVIAADIRDRLGCFRPGAMGNYSTAFSVVIRRKETELFALARQAAAEVAAIRSRPRREMLVLACYLRMRPELLDAAAISALGGFESASAAFVGGRMFGYAARDGLCVTNLGRIESDCVTEAAFIPPASPANRKTRGVLTVNGRMKICTAVSER